MATKNIGNGEIMWCGREKNVSIAIFSNKTIKKVSYGNISIVVLRGVYKRQLDVSIGEFERILRISKTMPEIKYKERKR